FDLDPLPDGPGEGTGAPRGGGVVLKSGVGSVPGVAVGRAGVDTALGRGRGDRCHPHVLGVCDEVLPGRVDHVGGGDVPFALLILCEGGGDVAAHVGVDDLAPAGGVGDDGVLGVDLLRPGIVPQQDGAVIGDDTLFGQVEQGLGAPGDTHRLVGRNGTDGGCGVLDLVDG